MHKLSEKDIAAIESNLSVLKWADILAIDAVAISGDRSEVIPGGNTVHVVHIKRKKVK